MFIQINKRILLCIFILSSLIAGASTNALPTFPVDSDSIQFAVIGDYGDGSQAEKDVANLVKSWNPDFVVTTGDNNYPGGAADTIDAHIGQFYHQFIYPYTGAYGPGATTNRFFPILGNNDWDTLSAKAYLDYFTLPGNERYYDYVWGPVHFFVIDSDGREPDGNTSSSTQAAWLRNQLSASTSVWNLVYVHHPPYSSGSVHSTTALQWPYAAWGADAVLAGHSHTYERIFQNGIVYFVNGLGGDSMHSIGTPVSGSQVRYNANYGAMLVDADQSHIAFQFINRAGTVIDSYTLYVPSAFSKIDPANATNQPLNLPLSWGASDNTSYYEYCVDTTNNNACNASWINNGNSTSAALSNLSLNTTYYWQVRAVNNSGTTTANGGTWWSFTTVSCYTLNKSVNPVGNGTITTDLAPNCNGGTQYTDGTIVQLTAIPKVNYAFNGWSGDLSGSTNPTSVTMTAGKSVTANFIPVQSFTDVPISYWAWSYIGRLYAAGITSGCGNGNYCPTTAVTRDQMAVFLLKGKHTSSYVPPAATGVFQDVAANYWAASWIEQLAAEGITSGCSVSPKQYCPTTPVTRDQMAVFLLKAKHGSNYAPPAATGVFQDVPTDYWAAAWIEQLAAEGITSGCSVTPKLFCPTTPVTRDQMAVFLVKNFNLP